MSFGMRNRVPCEREGCGRFSTGHQMGPFGPFTVDRPERRCRELAEGEYALDLQVSRYVGLYSELLALNSSKPVPQCQGSEQTAWTRLICQWNGLLGPKIRTASSSAGSSFEPG